MASRALIAMLRIALSSCCASALTVHKPAAGTVSISLNDTTQGGGTTGYVGDTVSVSGSSFRQNATIGATYDGSALPLTGQTSTGANGSFTDTFTVPASTAGGPSPPAMLAVCQACHQQNFVGGLPAPRLAGQRYEYLVAAMRDYAEGKRTNNAEMMRMMEAISPDERDAIARYLSGL